MLVVAGIVAALVVAVALLVRSIVASPQGGKGGHVAAAAAAAPAGASESGSGEDGVIHIPVLYGTQTNTAEGFARKLTAELNRKFHGSLVAEAVDLEDYEEATRLAGETAVLFCMATYGDGEPTTNAERFVEWLRSTKVDMGGVSYAVFGLGNTQYEHFNSCGKEVDTRMAELGARRIAAIGLGDDDGDIEADFDSWRPQLYEALAQRGDLVKGPVLDLGEVQAPTPVFTVDVLKRGRAVAPRSGRGTEQASPLHALISEVRELHSPASDRSCLHVELDLERSGLTYETGDHVGLFAENGSDIVDATCRALGMDRDTLIVMKRRPGGKEPYATAPIALGDAVARFADVTGQPKRDALLMLAESSTDAAEAARLRHLSSTAGRADFEAYIISAQRSLLEVMEDFPSCSPIPMENFFGVIAPLLQPRFYSISSSPLVHPDKIHVTAAVVRDRMPTGRVHNGVCTSWLARARAGETRVPIFVRRSTFKLQKPQPLSVSQTNGSTSAPPPIIMIGPGTGLAPFRGFMQERQAQIREKGSPASRIGEGVLFFGCRNRNTDFIYEEELQEFLADGAIDELHIAFSRDQSEKEYVQHKMVSLPRTEHKLFYFLLFLSSRVRMTWTII